MRTALIRSLGVRTSRSLLAKAERSHGGDRRSSSRAGTLKSYLAEIGLNKNRANECERIGRQR
jgi:hypothetical protein